MPKEAVRPTEQLVAKEIRSLVVDSLDDVLQCAYERACIGVRSVVYNVVVPNLFDMSRDEAIGEILEKHIAKFSDTSNTPDKVGV